MRRKNNNFRFAAILVIGVVFIDTPSIASLPQGMHEIAYPHRYFIRKSEFFYIYQVPPKIQSQIDISDDYLDHLEKKEFKKAEKWLIEKYNHPYYLLNLVLLYVYFKQPEYKNLFLQWQDSAKEPQVENLVEVLSAEKFTTALEVLSRDIKSINPKRYALYKVFRKKQNTTAIMANFLAWKKELPKTSEADLQKAKDTTLYARAYSNWNQETKILTGDQDTASSSTASKVIDDELEINIIEQKLPRSELTRYIEILLINKKWSAVTGFIKRIPWLTMEEKHLIMARTAEQERKSKSMSKLTESVKVKIIMPEKSAPVPDVSPESK